MTNGVLLFANNNEHIDYVKQSLFSARLIKQHLNCKVAVATDSPTYLTRLNQGQVDHIIELDPKMFVDQKKRYRDGTMSEKNLTWKNSARSMCYNITPFDQTVVLDTDVLVNNARLSQCFDQPEDLLIDRLPIDCHYSRVDQTFDKISDKSIDFYWATAFYFKKTPTTKLFFDLINHVQENYTFYRMMYQIMPTKLRNDFVFSIAVHIMNGFKFNPEWPKRMPCQMFYTTDKDILHEYQDGKYTLLFDKITHPGEYTVNTISDANLHVMNKFSLDRIVKQNV